MQTNEKMNRLLDALQEEVGDSALVEAIRLTKGDRHHSYGPPTKNFQVTATLIGEYLEAKENPFPVSPLDVAVIMILLKVARVAESPLKRDHMVDIAGYAGCGAECQDEERRVTEEIRAFMSGEALAELQPGQVQALMADQEGGLQ